MDDPRLLLAPLDDSGWIEKFRLRRTAGGNVDESSARLALAKTRFDEAVHAAIDTTKEPVVIAASRAPSFKPAKALRDAVNE